MIEIEIYNPIYHEEVVELVTSIQQKEFAIPITYEDQPDLADIAGFFDGFWVAKYSNKLVGTIGLKIIKDFALIRKMFVAEEFRGSVFGIGQKLLTSLEAEVSSRELSKIYLGTTEFFKAAHKFYEKNNYTEIPISNLPFEFPIMHIDTKFYLKGGV